jgi:hypothetical protein
VIRRLLAVLGFVAFANVGAAQSWTNDIKPGTYDLEIVFGGGTLEGRLEITAKGDSLVATMHVGDHQSPVRAGERKGTRLALVSTSPAMAVKYALEFSGDAVKGTFTYDGADGSVTGKRRQRTP